MMKWILSLMIVLTVAQSVACSDGNYNLTVAQSKQDAGEMDKRHYAAEFTKKLGSSVVLTRAEHIGRARAQTVLDMNSNLFQDDIKEMLQAGAWVVTLKTDNVQDDNATDANTVVALVSYGEGGANAEIEISPGVGTSFQVASGQIRISAYLEQAGPMQAVGGGAPPGNNVTPPISQRVSAFIKRAAYWSRTRRSFQRRGSIGAGLAIEAPIPNFASGFLLYSTDMVTPSPIYDPANRIEFIPSTDIFVQPVAQYDGPTLLQAAQNNNPVPIPASAVIWRWRNNVVSGGPTDIFTFEFYHAHD